LSGSPLEELIKGLDFDLYRVNAFRILGISIDSSPRQIKRVIEKLRLEEKLEQGKASAGYLMALVPEPTHEDEDVLTGKTRIELAQEAVERINDPQKRLVEELFWFWPCDPKNGSKDHAIQLTNAGDFAGAGEIWLQRLDEGDDSGIALHNLAVLNHMAALDLEYEQEFGALSADQKAYLEHHWQKAYEYWAQLLPSAAFWRRLDNRVKELDDPRLSKNTGNEIREILPTAVTMVAAKLSIHRASKGAEDAAKKHVQRMERSGFPTSTIQQAKTLANEPIRQRINILADSISRESESDPIHADLIVRRTLESVRLTLDLLATDVLFGKTHPTSLYMHDHIAEALLKCIVAFGHKTELWHEVVGLLEKVKSLARSSSTLQKVADAINQANESADSPFHWVVPGYYDLPEPVLSKLEAAKRSFERRDFDNAIGILESEYRVNPDHRAYIAKPLSFLLFIRAMQRYTDVSREVENAGPYLSSFKREQIRTNVSQVGRDLSRAVEMDPKNPVIRERYRNIQEIGRKIGASIPGISSGRYAPSAPGQSKPVSKPGTRPGSASNAEGSGVSPFGFIVIIFISIALLMIGVKACSTGGTTPPVLPPTSAIRSTPTRRTPTSVPTRTRTPQLAAVGISSNCIRWDQVGQTHVGRSICIYGIVKYVKPGNGVYTLEFSDDWTDTKVQDYNHYWRDINVNECIEVYGTVRDNVSFLFISPDRDNPEIFGYPSTSACR